MPSTSPPVPTSSPRPAPGRADGEHQPRPPLSSVVEFIVGRPMPRPLRGLLDDLDDQHGGGERR